MFYFDISDSRRRICKVHQANKHPIEASTLGLITCSGRHYTTRDSLKNTVRKMVVVRFFPLSRHYCIIKQKKEAREYHFPDSIF